MTNWDWFWITILTIIVLTAILEIVKVIKGENK